MVAELIDRAPHRQPRPPIPHAIAGSTMGMALGGAFQMGADGPRGWRILDAPEPHLGDDILAPDLAGWRRERMPAPPDAAYSAPPPEWVCETLSPGARRLDLGRKRDI